MRVSTAPFDARRLDGSDYLVVDSYIVQVVLFYMYNEYSVAIYGT